jgi:hypothetical protein
LRRAEALGGIAEVRAMLHRVRGCALMTTDAGAAKEALEASLQLARSSHASFEIALTLLARARLGQVTGDPLGTDVDEALGLLDELGVEGVPEVPVPAAVTPPGG